MITHSTIGHLKSEPEVHHQVNWERNSPRTVLEFPFVNGNKLERDEGNAPPISGWKPDVYLSTLIPHFPTCYFYTITVFKAVKGFAPLLLVLSLKNHF